MRKLIVLPLLAACTFAGTEPSTVRSSKDALPSAKAPIAPTPSPNLYRWFMGGTAGYLFENEEEFYSGHIGVDLPYTLGGWNTAVYLEVGWTELDCSISGDGKCDGGDWGGDWGGDHGGDWGGDEGGDWGGDHGGDWGGDEYRNMSLEMEMIPVTLNYKLERDLTNSLRTYLSAGLGVAFLDLDVRGGSGDDDTVFFAQASAGVLYEVNDSFELFAGGRLIYFDDPSFKIDGESIDLDDGGCDIENVDGLLEIGGRFNF